ncbi:MAG TPA: hypothetical protein VGC04_09305 [Cellulomonas sp.]
MHLTHRYAAPLAMVALVALAGGCSSQDAWAAPHASPVAVGTLGPGFVGSTRTPAPEGTITPVPGSWDGVRPPAGYRVVLLVGDSDDATTTEADAVRSWATAQDASLRTITVTDPNGYVDGIVDALKLQPDLVVGVGNDLMPPLALVSASNLQQQFLTVGAQIAEPTANVTAAVWDDASLKSEGVGLGSSFDPAAVTPERAESAVRAGVASILSGWTGIIVWLS